MKNIFALIILFYVLSFNLVFSQVISGKVNHDDVNYKNKIIDYKTQKTLSDAKITIPELHYTTYSDKNGCFKLNADISGKTVLFVEKEGYKVFSLTVDNNVLNKPLTLGIEQNSPFDMQISHGIIHLGDNMFSSNSANSSDFKLSANGFYYSQMFKKPIYGQKQDVIVKIGTVIGLDTKRAKMVGQNSISSAYSSPTEIFVNGHKIGKLDLNGDNIEIIVPKNILKVENVLVIKTGRNLFQTRYVDYDDIELANIRVEIKDKFHYAKH